MSIRQTLNEVLAGTKPPAAFLSAVDEYLAQPNANLAALRSLIDAAEQLGLPTDVAAAARARLTSEDGVLGIGEPTRVAGSDDTTEMITPDATKVDIGEPTRVVEESDPDRTEITTASAPTRLRADPADIDLDRTVVTGDADRTIVTGGDNDTTQVNPDTDATVQVGGEDPFAMATSSAKGGDELGPGSVLKGRFRLEEVIGQGGMGAVYKAVDLLKVEARDRNPYIAVKLLVGDFKEHPEAFIALQRESAKAQRLAHPNIATVYDFDRDGETVYMTMELMVGAELAKYIKKLPAGGLPVLEAMKIIEQLCSGLQYAHARGLVHSDFKPGNAFLLEDGTVKLLDFGIARASKTKADAEGESTVFDPGQLGALTPAYATIEMFEGQDPDPRDDIYALACVAYELFTGKHPFNKMSAVKAKEKGLKPAPVDKLTKRQNKTLMKALALHRDDRTPSVDEFWENIKPRKDYTLHIAAGATAAVLLLGALLYNPVVNLIHDREYNAIVAATEADVPTGLALIDELPTPERREEAARRARAPILAYFSERANAALLELDYPTALAEFNRAQHYLNDVEVANKANDIRNEQNTAALGRSTTVSDLLVKGTRTDGQSAAAHRAVLEQILLPNETELDLPEAVTELRRIKPDDKILEDPRISGQYGVLVEAAVSARQWQRADEILKLARDIAPTSPQLSDFAVEVGAELRRQQEAAQVASLRETLQRAAPRTIADFRAVNEQLQQLGALRPDDSVVRGLDGALQAAVRGEVQRHTQAGQWAEADALLVEFAPALPLDFLVSTRGALTADQRAAGFTNPDAARASRLATLIASVKAMVAEPDFQDIAYSRSLLSEFKQATALAGADDAEWQALRESVVAMHVSQARELAERDLHRQAASVLDQGVVFDPDHAAFADARTALAAAELEYNAERARQEALARIETEKKQMLDLAATADPKAVNAYRALLTQLSANDPFVEQGAVALEAMYLSLAANAVNNNPAQAVELLEGGLLAVDRPALRQRRDEYRLLANAAAVANAARNLSESGFAAWRTRYTQAREALPQNRRAAFDNDVVNALYARLNQLNESSSARPLRALVVDLFSGQQRQRLADMNLREPSRFAAGIRSLIDEHKLSEAGTALASAQQAERGHPQLAGFDAEISRLQREAAVHYNNAQAERNATLATQHIERALEIWADNPEYLDFKRRVRGTVATVTDEGARPCTGAHAAQGRRTNGRCNDVVAPRNPAPSLVVVPAGDGHPAFAISRQEITVEDFNKYCAATSACQAIGGDNSMPVTNISIQQADAYVAWLSQVTGKAYRIPSSAEWRYAANAGGSPGVAGNYNCTVLNPNGTKAKGASVQRSTAGEQNGWGMLNMLGNVQEWTRDGGSLKASGASHEDSLSDCRTDFVRPHSGAADAVTGFRVAREAGF